MGFWRRLAVFVLAAFVSAQAHPLASAGDQEVLLRGGTPVFAVFDHSIDSDSVKEGVVVYLRVMRPILSNDVVVIRTGEKVVAKVTEVRDAGGWGKRGNLVIRVDSTTTVDGQEVLLSGTQRREGEGKGGTAAAVGVGAGIPCLPAALFGFAVKGEEGHFPAGYEIKAYVDQDYKVKVAAAQGLTPADEWKQMRKLQEEIEEKVRDEKRKKEEEEKGKNQQSVEPMRP